MDIIDIVIAKKKSFTGETESLIQQAQAAMAQANEVASILQEAQEANAAAQEANDAVTIAQERAETIAEDFDNLKSDFTTAAEELVENIVDTKLEPTNTNITALQNNVNDLIYSVNTLNNSTIPQLQDTIALAAQSGGDTVTITDNTTTAAKSKTINIIHNGNTSSYNIEKNYTSEGENEDGSMTQKAIKAYVNNIKEELNTRINNITISGGTSGEIHFSLDDAGHIVIVGPDGTLISGSAIESDIIAALIKAEIYNLEGVVGLIIDYENKLFTRTQDAVDKQPGTDFNTYPMYGGRMRCNVSDNGAITAFYGDNNYREDGSNGQVMVYQPKFYYQRTPITMTRLVNGNSIRKEALILSQDQKSGFKLHPLFINEYGEEIEYVLLPAFQGSIYDISNNNYDLTSNLTIDFNADKLSSIAGAKPISGETNELTSMLAEKLATNRGSGWHITNMAAESATQMLCMIEFGQLNIQSAIEKGIVKIPTVSGKNCASLTGSTSSLGNITGAASLTRNELNGNYTDYNTEGQRAVSYRGMENPWGNLWHFIGGVNIYGYGNTDGGYPYICKNFNYNVNSITEDYINLGFKLPSTHSWISAMGYGNSDYDWVYMPSEAYQANSLLPVGDSIWTSPSLDGIDCATIGGSWASEDSGGLFYYGCDMRANYTSPSFGANLMFIPIKNSVYVSNYNKWAEKLGLGGN